MQQPNEKSFERRKFIHAAAMAGAAAIAAPVLGRVLTQVTGSSQIKVALIGCGGRGTGAAEQALKADPGVVIWVMADTFADRIESAHAELTKRPEGSRVMVPPERRFTGFDAGKLACASDVDVVILATAPYFRPMHLRAAVDAGKNIFCEKPMFTDAAGAQIVIQCIEDARAKKLQFMSGFCWRYSLPERETFMRIRGGDIGEVLAMHSDYLTSPLGTKPRKPQWSDMEFQLRNWQHHVWLSGDFIVEQAIHSIDKINWAFGNEPPTRCTATGGRGLRENIPERGDVYDHFAVVYEWPRNRRATLICRQQDNCFNENVDTVLGSKGSAFINGWGPTHEIIGEHPWSYPPDGPNPNMYQTEHDEFYKALRSGKRIDDGNFVVNSCRMALMGRMAAYTGQDVTWDQVVNSKENLGPDKLEMGNAPPVVIRVPGNTKLI